MVTPCKEYLHEVRKHKQKQTTNSNMKATRIQPLTVNGNNINRLRKKIYNMFADLVPSKSYKYHGTGSVKYNSLPFYQCGGSDTVGRSFILKGCRFPTQEEAVAFELIASSLKNEGVYIKKDHYNRIIGLRLMYKPRTKDQPKPSFSAPDNAYRTEDNAKTESHSKQINVTNIEMFVVVKKDNNLYYLLSKHEIEKNIIQDNDYLNKVNIFKVGEKVAPKVQMTVNF